MYDDKLKRHSVAKSIVNKFLTEFVHPGDAALVIDGPSLRSSTALRKKLTPDDIRVVSIDPKTVKNARKCGFRSDSGFSTEILKNLSLTPTHRTYKMMYLDYCGTPTKKKEWDPAEDFQIASTMLAVDGLLVATFSRRCSRAMQKIKELLWPSATIIATFCYCETTAMVTVLVGRGDHRMPFIRSTTHLFKTVQQLFPLPSRHQCRVSSRGRLLRKRTFFVSEVTPSSTAAPVRRSKRLRLQY